MYWLLFKINEIDVDLLLKLNIIDSTDVNEITHQQLEQLLTDPSYLRILNQANNQRSCSENVKAIQMSLFLLSNYRFRFNFSFVHIRYIFFFSS